MFGQSDFQVSKTIFDSREILVLELLLLFWSSCYFLELLLGSSIWWRELGETPSASRWLALKDAAGKVFQVPKSCEPCRKLRREQWNLHSRNPLPDSAAFDTAIMTVAIDQDIDPDDDFAMADYASRFSDP